MLEVGVSAARSAAVFAQWIGLSGQRCVTEGDMVIIIAAMNGHGEDCSPIGPIINDARELIKGRGAAAFVM
ncbi:hypothetical protein ACFX13_035199 [Malus domestica]